MEIEERGEEERRSLPWCAPAAGSGLVDVF